MATAPAVVALLWATVAGAAPAPSAPAGAQQRHNSDAPIDWEADRIEVQDRDHRATLTGAVRVRQAEMMLTANRMTANYTGSIAGPQGPGPATGGSGGPKVQRLDANGNVVVTRPGETARGNYGIYDLGSRLVTLIGNVSLDRGGSVVRGGRMVVDLNTNRATVDGSAIGGGSAGKGGRVSGRFTVDQKPGAPAK